MSQADISGDEGEGRRRPREGSLISLVGTDKVHHPDNQRAVQELRELADQVNTYMFRFRPHRLPPFYRAWLTKLTHSRGRHWSEVTVEHRVFEEGVDEFGASGQEIAVGIQYQHQHQRPRSSPAASSAGSVDNTERQESVFEEDGEDR